MKKLGNVFHKKKFATSQRTCEDTQTLWILNNVVHNVMLFSMSTISPNQYQSRSHYVLVLVLNSLLHDLIIKLKHECLVICVQNSMDGLPKVVQEIMIISLCLWGGDLHLPINVLEWCPSSRWFHNCDIDGYICVCVFFVSERKLFPL